MKSNPVGLELARRQRAQGVILEIPEDDSETGRRSALEFYQDGECTILPLDEHRCGYIFDLHIVSNWSCPFEISRVEVELPWGLVPIDWLPEPGKWDGAIYRFPGKGSHEYPQAQVINKYVNLYHILRRGDSVSGWLLGVGERIPDRALCGEISGFVNIFNQFSSKFQANVSFVLHRVDWERRRTREKKQRKPLFEFPDAIGDQSKMETSTKI